MADVNPLDVQASAARNKAAIAATRPPEPEDSNPPLGRLEGELFLSPELSPQVPSGSPRPFAPGEYIMNKDPKYGWSSEISLTVQDPRLAGGKPTNIPSLWLVDGQAHRVDEPTAIEYAIKSGLPFRTYSSLFEADKAAEEREQSWQPIRNPQDAKTIPSLWDSPSPANVAKKSDKNKDRLKKMRSANE